jgi:hypothetical protein
MEMKKPTTLAETGSSSVFVESEPCLLLASSFVKQREKEREWLFKSHCASWSWETACRQLRICLKKPNSGLTRMLRSKLRILVGPKTGHCLLNYHLHNICAICIACGMEDELALHFLCSCLSLISLILGLDDYGRRKIHYYLFVRMT